MVILHQSSSSKRRSEEPECDPSAEAPSCVKPHEHHRHHLSDLSMSRKKKNRWSTTRTSLTRQGSSESLGTVSTLSMSSVLGYMAQGAASRNTSSTSTSSRTAPTSDTSPTPDDFSRLQVKNKPRKYPSVDTIVGLIHEEEILHELNDAEEREEDSNAPREDDRHSRFEQQLAAKLAAGTLIDVTRPVSTSSLSNVPVVSPPQPAVPVLSIEYSVNGILREDPSLLTTDCELASNSPRRHHEPYHHAEAALEEGQGRELVRCLSVHVLEDDENEGKTNKAAEENWQLLVHTYWKLLVALIVLTCLFSISFAIQHSKNNHGH